MSEDDLKKRIAAAKAKHDDDPTNDPGYDPNKGQDKNAMGTAMRAGVELVSAVAVGSFIGYWIDSLPGF